MARYDDPSSRYDDPGTRYDDPGGGGGGSSGTGSLVGAKKTTVLLDSPFDSAFYSGASVVTDAPRVFDIALNGHQYRIDTHQYRRNTLPTLRPPQDNSTEPGEQSLNTESVWRRSQSDWILGAGQPYFDDLAQPASNRNQFASSKGFNPWVRRALTLQHDTRKIFGSVNTNLQLLATPTLLYAASGSTLQHTSNPEAAGPIWTAANLAGTAPVTDMTLVGNSVYVAKGADGIKTTVLGSGTSASWSSYTASRLEFTNGFMFAAKPGEIVYIDNAGTAHTLLTHFDATIEWTDIVGTPGGAYVCGNTLGKAEIYYIGIDTATGAPAVPVFAGSLPGGETINQLAYYDGLMLLGTSNGLRLANITSANSLQHGPLISVSGGVTAFEPQGEFCWFSWSNFDSQSTGLGRALLSRNTEPGLPAYATDLMATAQGLVTTVATWNGRRYFGVVSQGIYGEFEDYVPTAQLNSGFIRFGTTERKVATSVDVHHDPLPTGATVQVSLLKDDESEVQCGTSSDVGTLGPPDPYSCKNAQGEAMSVIVRMTRGSVKQTSPTLRRWTLRATPTPIRTDEIILPLILRSVVSTGEEVGQDIPFDTLAEFQFLKNLEASRQVCTYQEGKTSYSVQVDRVMVRPEKWSPERSYFDGLVFVRLLTIGA